MASAGAQQLVSVGPDDMCLVPEEIASIERCLGAPVTRIVCKAQTEVSHTEPLGVESLAGQHLWLQPPASHIASIVSSYLQSKQQAPSQTSACVLVPRWRRASWRRLLHGMQLVRTYSKGQQVFTDGAAGVRALPWDCEVWYDRPAPDLRMAAAASEVLTMHFRGAVRGAAVSVLVDTGASDVFVTARLCAQLGLQVGGPGPGERHVTLADGASCALTGVCNLPLRMGAYRGTVRAHVMDSLLNGFDLVLGDAWLRAHSAVLNFRRCTLELHAGGRFVSLRPVAVAGLPGEGPPAQTPAAPRHQVISALQMRKELRRAGRAQDLVFLVHVRADGHGQGQGPGGGRDMPSDPGSRSQRCGLVPGEVIDSLLGEFADVMPDELPGEPIDRGIGHTIPLVPGEHKPPSRPLYRLSPLEMDEVRKQVADLLRKGLIEPSQSPYGAPILFVQKKDGSLRMCIDYRALNKLTVRNQYPLPRIDDLLDRLQGARVFSALDLQSGYHQIRITEEDRPKTAFKTPMGLYQFKVLSFGLCNAPSTFPAVMNSIFGDLIGHGVLVYLDDILVYSRTPGEHIALLRKVFERLRRHKLYVKRSKCEFNRAELPFLGHVVGAEGVKVDPSKAAAVREFPRPATITQLRSFMGLANYFRKFVKGFSHMAAPLTSAMSGAKNASVEWTTERATAFDAIRAALASPPTLAMADPSKPYVVTTDASDVGIGAVLEQGGRPVAFESRALIPAERNYSATDREMLAVVHALRTWRCYLEGGKGFQVLTDHNPNTYFASKAMLSRREARWAEFLQQFDFTMRYKAGKENVVADALSRAPLLGSVCWVRLRQPVLSVMQTRRAVAREKSKAAAELAGSPEVADSEETLAEYRHQGVLPVVDVQPPRVRKPRRSVRQQVPDTVRDAVPGTRSRSLIERVKSLYVEDPLCADPKATGRLGLEFREGLWWRLSQVYVPPSEAVRDAILSEMHDSPSAGHVGITKSVRAVARLWWWPSLRADVEAWVKSCPVCQRDKGDRRNRGLLQPLQVPTRAWDSVSMDLITQLPSTRDGLDAIIVFVDRLTKMVHFAPCATTATAEDTARLFVRHVWRLHGVPRELVTDRDPRFTSAFAREVARLVGTKQCMSTAYHPQSDGQTERTNRTLEDMLRHYVAADQRDWDEHLDAAEFAVNNSWQESVKETPFMLNYGFHPNTPLSLLVEQNSTVPAAVGLVQRIADGIARARAFMKAAQDRYKAHADSKRVDCRLAVGDQVMLSVSNLRLKGTKKLMPRWLGPFPVVAEVSPVAYRLALPSALTRLHPVFHVGLLKPYVADAARARVVAPLPELDRDGELVWAVERLVDHRDVPVSGRSRRTRREYLVRWAGFAACEDTWEPASNLLEGAADMVAAYWNSVGRSDERGQGAS